jgi:hypothetical protein
VIGIGFVVGPLGINLLFGFVVEPEKPQFGFVDLSLCDQSIFACFMLLS